MSEDKLKKETEVIIYAKISNPDGLNEASSIVKHIQYDGKFSTGNSCRVRNERRHNIKELGKYYFTFKVKDKSNEGFEINDEHTIEIDYDFFNSFKLVAEKEIIKTRYSFNSTNVELKFINNNEEHTVIIPNIEYEVDIFTKDSVISKWCKIDIEIDNILNFIEKEYPDIKDINLKIKLSHLPFKPTNMTYTSDTNTNVKDFIDSLWKNEFSTALNV